MYQAERPSQLPEAPGTSVFSKKYFSNISSGVVFIGLTSFFTDISAEMVAAILPLYALFVLQLPVLQFGILDGLYQGASAIVRLVAGHLSDRFQKAKAVATTGYAVSAVSKCLLLLGTGWGALSGAVLLDRIGKGIRTPSRDTLIARNTGSHAIATGFGIHRAFDTAGALLGPLIAAIILYLLPGNYRIIFLCSIVFALIGLAILVVWVKDKPATGEGAKALTVRQALTVFTLPRFTSIFIVSALLSVVTVSDSFIYLTIAKATEGPAYLFPFLYVITALVYMLGSIPAGITADRIGKRKVFLGGYALLICAYALLLWSTLNVFFVCAILLFLGLYYAATDGVLMAEVTSLLPDHIRATGTALVATGIGVAKIGSSVLYGLLWTLYGTETALLCFFAGLVFVGAAAMKILYNRSTYDV